MSKIALEGNASGTGTFTVAAPNSNSNYTLTLPTSSGTVVVTGGAQTIEFAAGSASTPSITFTGDTNTGIFSPAADTIAFAEGGAEAMRIDSSGRVLVNKTSWSGDAKFVVGPDTNGGVARLAISSNTTGDNPVLELFEGTTRRVFLNYDTTNNIANLTTEESGSALAFQTNSTERMRIDSSGNVGIGTSSPSYPLSVSRAVNGGVAILDLDNADDGNYGGLRVTLGAIDRECRLAAAYGSSFFTFYTDGSERARITSGGDFLIGRTSDVATDSGITLYSTGQIYHSAAADTQIQRFYNSTSGNQVGSIAISTTNTTFNTSSDYRLKENIAPMTGALSTVAQLKPCTYTWKATGKQSQGFIAHELQAVVPDCVTGEKDATEIQKYEVTPAVYEDVVIPAVFDDEGNEIEPKRTEKRLVSEAVMGEREVPLYQGVDTSFLVATLTAAIQELKAELDTVKAELSALKGN